MAVSLSARGGIDFTPTVTEYTAEGISFRQLSFRDGKRRVVYEPPRGWSYRGGGNDLQLVPPAATRADASIQVADLNAPQPFDEKLIAGLREQCLRNVPAGSQSVKVVAEEQNPVRIGRGDSYAITVSYQALGEIFLRSVLLVNLTDAQLTFRFTARKADFDQLQRTFRSSIFSWHWVEPSSTAAVVQK